jgi:NADH:ubiquinone oxidoreductase subunit F (NADH-binding)
MTPPPALPWLLAGRPQDTGPEPLSEHRRRLGPIPEGGPALLAALRHSGLQGRGGARFPTAVKWEAVAASRGGRPVVVANGAEGEPASWKDQLLMSLRPHLVIDGALLAAQTVGASDVVLYVSRAFPRAIEALEAALAERGPGRRRPRVRVATAPARYVAGEETAAVSLLDGGEARPAFVPPRPFERGVGGRPTLVQNVETLALVALLARFGPSWFRNAGTPAAPGPMLVTVRGAVPWPGVFEVAHGTPLPAVVDMAGGRLECTAGILVGGYFGSWIPGETAASLTLDDQGLARGRARPGCGVVLVLPEAACGVAETSRVLAFLAHESARQCGPCREGLPALAGLAQRLAVGRAGAGDAERLDRWTHQLGGGRGACKHPDGAVGLWRSALDTFAADVRAHLAHRPCPHVHRPSVLPFPRPSEEWR